MIPLCVEKHISTALHQHLAVTKLLHATARNPDSLTPCPSLPNRSSYPVNLYPRNSTPLQLLNPVKVVTFAKANS
jgi:hypothetical protein